MKLTYFQLEAHLAKPLAPIYIVGGEELLLKQDAFQWIRKAAKQQGFNERIRLILDTKDDSETLYSALYAKSLMADKSLIEIDFRDTIPNKSVGELLKQYSEAPSPDSIVLIDVNKIDDKITRSAWFKACEKIGNIVNIWPIPREQLPPWIMNRTKKYKINLQHDAANLLADYVEGNLSAAAQIIEKLYLLKPTEPINAEMINQVFKDESRFSVFDFIENLIAGDKTRTLHILENLKNEGIEPILILWGITRELRLLADLAQQLKQGSTCENLFPKYRIFFKRQNAIRQFLNKHSAEVCWGHIEYAAKIDALLKGAGNRDPWEQLQLYALRVCG